jgi:Domain of unknown function (DUF1736)
MFSVLVSMMIFLLARLALLQGSLPRFSQQDNPAAFHSSFQTRILTFLYLSSFNLWLLLCPSQLSHDWQMGSIPLVLSVRDSRNLLTVFTISAIICLVYKIYNDLEVSLGTIYVLDLNTLLCHDGDTLNEWTHIVWEHKNNDKHHQQKRTAPARREIICENYWH